jgi:hypothetical protein
MLPVIVSPFHDTDGLMFAHLESVVPLLKNLFSRAFLSMTPLTQQTQAGRVEKLAADAFFALNYNQPDTLIGDHFLAGYQNAASHCAPTQILHLCTLDRVVFALQTEHQARFMADIKTASDVPAPILFQRSAAAWATHPRNYREIEHLATRAGQILFDKSLDFVWCHLVIGTGELQEIWPRIQTHDLRVLAEMVLLLRDKLEIREVDWLAWEDPFIFSRDANQMKEEFERSRREHRKRLGYTIPILQLLLELVE